MANERDPGLPLGAHEVALVNRRAQRVRLEADCDEQNENGQPDVLEFVGMRELVDAFVDREAGTARKY